MLDRRGGFRMAIAVSIVIPIVAVAVTIVPIEEPWHQLTRRRGRPLKDHFGIKLVIVEHPFALRAISVIRVVMLWFEGRLSMDVQLQPRAVATFLWPLARLFPSACGLARLVGAILTQFAGDHDAAGNADTADHAQGDPNGSESTCSTRAGGRWSSIRHQKVFCRLIVVSDHV